MSGSADSDIPELGFALMLLKYPAHGKPILEGATRHCDNQKNLLVWKGEFTSQITALSDIAERCDEEEFSFLVRKLGDCLGFVNQERTSAYRSLVREHWPAGEEQWATAESAAWSSLTRVLVHVWLDLPQGSLLAVHAAALEELSNMFARATQPTRVAAERAVVADLLVWFKLHASIAKVLSNDVSSIPVADLQTHASMPGWTAVAKCIPEDQQLTKKAFELRTWYKDCIQKATLSCLNEDMDKHMDVAKPMFIQAMEYISMLQKHVDDAQPTYEAIGVHFPV